MARFYQKERAKYGNLTGQIIMWPVEYIGDPNEGNNPTNLPAGYLKCDGAKYYAEDYPQLAAILGTGDNTAFRRLKLDQVTPMDANLSDVQFVVPDLGSKYPEPTTGANSGLYNNIRVLNSNGQEVSRSGIGIEATNQTGQVTNTVQYRGDITLPSQEIPITGRPGYTYAGTTHRLDDTDVEEAALAPHTHFHSGRRARNMTRFAYGTSPADTNDNPRWDGETGVRNASTINIYDWIVSTRFSPTSAVTKDPGYSCTGVGSGKLDFISGCTAQEIAEHPTPSTLTGGTLNPPGLGQQPCKAMQYWNPNSGTSGTGNSWVVTAAAVFCSAATGYWGGCIEDGPPDEAFKWGCLLVAETKYDRGQTWGSADGSHTALGRNQGGCFGICATTGNFTGVPDRTGEAAATYTSGAPGVPTDFANNSLYDVLPLQSNEGHESKRAAVALEHVSEETADLTQTTDGTIHNHRIDIDQYASGDHTYKVKTNAAVIRPENLSTTLTIGTDSSPSIDSAVAPFIVMEYLIKT